MIRFKGQKHVVYHMDFFPDSSYLATIGGKSNAVWLWNLKDPKKAEKYQLPNVAKPQEIMPLLSVAVSHNGEIILPVLICRNVSDRIRSGYQQLFYFISWPSREVRIIPTDPIMNGIRILPIKSRRLIVTSENFPICSEIGPKIDWERIHVGSNSQQFWISDSLEWFALREDGVRIYHRPTNSYFGHRRFRHYYSEVVFSPSAEYFVVNSLDQYFEIFETKTFLPLGRVINIPSDYIEPKFAFTPNGKKFLITSVNILHVYDTLSGEELASYDFNIDRIVAMKISDDGLMYAVSGENKEIVVADIES